MNLSSDPPLSERDLQRLLLTGQAADGDIRSAGSEQFALTALSSDLLGIAGQAMADLGLDYVRIGSESFELVSSDVDAHHTPDAVEDAPQPFRTGLLGQPRQQHGHLDRRVSSARRHRAARVVARQSDRAVEFRHQFAFGPGGTPTPDAPKSGERPTARDPVSKLSRRSTSWASRRRRRHGSGRCSSSSRGRTFDYSEWMRDHDRLRRHLSSTRAT